MADSDRPATREALRLSLKQPIVFDGASTPVKAALFLVVCLAWLLPGLVGRDPWKPDEAASFGVIHAMLQGDGWIVPAIVGVPFLESPPFAAWVAAASASLFAPWLPLHDGARLVSALWVALTMGFCARAAVELSDERAGRIAALTVLGSAGLLLRGHEISFALAPMAGTAMAFHGLAVLDRQPRTATVWLATGAALVALTAGLVPALLCLVPACAMMAWRQAWRRTAVLRSLSISLAVVLLAALLWPALMLSDGTVPVQQWLPTALGIQSLSATGRSFDATYFTRLLPWYALPSLPIAMWIWIKERGTLGDRLGLQLPLVTFVVLLLGYSMVREPRDDMALPLLVPLVVVAVQALDRLPRGLASFVDWLGLVTFLFIAGLLWSGWAGVVTGVPRGAAKWAARQAPGYVHELSWAAFIIAATLTVIWLVAVLRTRRTNRRAIVNWCAGITLVWMLANLLWLPAIDHVRSYRGTAAAIKSALPTGADCLGQMHLGDPQRAAFHYHGGLRFRPVSALTDSDCGLVLIQGVAGEAPAVPAGWTLLWDGARPGDRAERFRLYSRQAN
ncbi:MAG: hypothetical protein JNM76_02335 [Betaproteobacteria bacterium]|nr:hypothetical protein [Betaproteobacteria bacterium]